MSEVKADKQNITIREATLLDFPKLIPLIRAFVMETEPRTYSERELDRALLTVFRSLAEETASFLVAEKPKRGKYKLIGYAVFDIREDIFGRLVAWGHHLYLSPESRHTDIADRVVKLAEEKARERGALTMFIDTAYPGFFINKFGYEKKYTVVSKSMKEVGEHVEQRR